MAEVDPLGDLDRYLGDVQSRLLALRDADPPDTPQTVVPELEAAVDQLRRVSADLSGRAGDAAARQGTLDRERLLLRAVFHGLPTAVFLVDRDGRIRRANSAAQTLLGVSADYVSGQPLTAFVDAPDRSSFRIRLATLLRSGEPQEATVGLLGRGRRQRTRLALSSVELPSDPRPLVLVLAVPADARLDPSAGPAGQKGVTGEKGMTPSAEGGTSGGPDSEEIRSQARAADMVGEVTRILLAETGSTEAVLLQRVAARLTDGFADWVVVDTRRGEAALRITVATPAAEADSLLAKSLERAEVTAAPLLREVIELGIAVLQPHLDDLGGLGSDERGVSYLGAIGAHSLLCAPMIRTGKAVGALTLVRTGTNEPFRLTEQAAAEEMGDLLGRALDPPRPGTTAPGSTEAPEPFLPQRMLSSRAVDIAWMHLGGQGGAAPFVDFYDLPGGWGASLGSVPVGGLSAQAHAAMVRQWALLVGSAGHPPEEVLGRLDEGVRRLRPGDPPVSVAVLTMLNKGDHLATTIASAGHRSSLCLRSDGRVQRTDGGGIALNAPGGPSVHLDSDRFGVGECLVVYTNELPELCNETGQTFGGSGELANSLARVAGQSARRVVDSLTGALTAFAPGPPKDAVVALVIRFLGPE